MNKRITQSILFASLTALTSMPASAQIRADIGPLHIRVIPEAPPPVRYERRPARPARDYVWIGGYWDRRDDRWEWVGGRWDRPSDRRYSWVRPRYVREWGRYRYEPGHWSNERLEESDESRGWRRDHGRR